MKRGHDKMKIRCGFYSKLGYCEGVVEELGRELKSYIGEGSFPPPQVDETLYIVHVVDTKLVYV